jgi:YjbE family integral membrane protein
VESLFDPAVLRAFVEVMFINVVLSGDNAIVVGMAAAAAPVAIRSKIVFWGLAGAVVLRLVLAAVAVQLLSVIGVLLAGGILLLWVCWKMYRDLRQSQEEHIGAELFAEGDNPGLTSEDINVASGTGPRKTLGAAIWQILIADVSMSLDNVLAVAGAAREHPYIMALGLIVSIGLMGAAATFIARLLDRYHWLGWIGLLIILWVAVKMVWEGVHQVGTALA